MLKVQLLLALRDGQSRDVSQVMLDAESRRVRGLLPHGCRQRTALRLHEDPTSTTAHGSNTGGQRPFDALFEVATGSADTRVIVSAVSGMAGRWPPCIDAQASAALVGEEVVIAAGDCPLLSVYALRRRPSMTPAEFHDYWLHEHVKMHIRVAPPTLGYRQFHADAGLTAVAASATGLAIDDLDGVAEGYWTSIDQLLANLSKSEVTGDEMEDERKFIDHSRSVFMMMLADPAHST